MHAHVARMTQGSQHVQDTSEDDLTLLDEKDLDSDFAGTCTHANFRLIELNVRL